jgi:hypothetical protein
MNGNGNGRLGVTEYAELVSRVRDEVAATVPPGASVLVVSKGDAALLDLGGLSAAHFPQDAAGGYAGHHPRDGAAATAELEGLRRAGAEYLVIPATARWWLDFYAELAAYLASHGELLADVPGACLIYGLGRQPVAVPTAPMTSRREASVAQIRDYLENLFAEDCQLVVLEAVEGVAMALAPLQASRLPAEEKLMEDDSLLARLDGYAAAGARYLVVPRSSDEWLKDHAAVEERLEESLRKVADQRHLCRVFEINEVRKER